MTSADTTVPLEISPAQRTQLRNELENSDGALLSAEDASVVAEVLGANALAGGGSLPYRLRLSPQRQMPNLRIAGYEGKEPPAPEPPAEDTGRDERAAATISKFTDNRNQAAFVSNQNGEISWVEDASQWREWHPPVWEDVGHPTIVERARIVGEKIHTAAVASGNKADAIASARAEGFGAIKAMVELAKGDPTVTSKVRDWDAHPTLLNTESGVISLPSLTIRPTKPADRFTTLLPCKVNLDAQCPLWDEFLQTTFAGDEQYVSYVQHLAGLCLLGETSGAHMFFLYGDGANGKSVFVNTLIELLGPDLSTTLPASALSTRRTSGDEYALATLVGKRVAVANEVSEGSHLDESLIKNMTGGDTMTVRQIREAPITFRPAATLIMVGNHKPIIKGTDGGIWRRVQMLPFSVTIPKAEQDQQLGEKLRAEHEGILAWALRGAASYRRSGSMPACAVVENETRSFKSESDIVQQFIDECCTLQADGVVSGPLLYEVYSGWCRRSNEKALTKTMFGKSMERLGFEAVATAKERRRRGLELNATAIQTYSDPIF